MKILFLHGLESSPTSRKVEYLRSQGFNVAAPNLGRKCFEHSVVIARNAAKSFTPDVIVGSSRGGAIAMKLGSLCSRLVLVAPAWKKYGVPANIPSDTLVLHSCKDDVIPLFDSELLVSDSKGSQLHIVGDGHRMSDPTALDAIAQAVRKGAA